MANKKIGQFPNKPVPSGTDKFLIEDNAGNYFYVTEAQLAAILGGSLTLSDVLTNGNVMDEGQKIQSSDLSSRVLANNGVAEGVYEDSNIYTTFNALSNRASLYAEDLIGGDNGEIKATTTENKLTHTVKNTFSAPINQFDAENNNFNGNVVVNANPDGETISIKSNLDSDTKIVLGISDTNNSYANFNDASANTTISILGETGQIIADSFKVDGGTSSQFLKGDGTVDNNTYLTTTSAASTYEVLSNKTDTVSGNITSSTKYLSVKGYYDYLIGFTWLTDSIFGTWINGLTSKTTPVDADQVVLMDSADSNKSKKLSWANIKATINAYLFNKVNGGNANYSIADSDRIIYTGTAFTAPRVWTLPTASGLNAEKIVADYLQTVTSTNTLTIVVQTGEYLNGVLNGTEVISSPGGWRRFLPNGTNNWSFDAGIARLGKTQTFTGTNTFSNAPIIPTQTQGDNSTKAASTAYVDTAVAAASPSAAKLFNYYNFI